MSFSNSSSVFPHSAEGGKRASTPGSSKLMDPPVSMAIVDRMTVTGNTSGTDVKYKYGISMI